MLPALIEVVTNALMSLIPDTKAKAIAVPMTDANQVLRTCPEISSADVTQQIIVETQQSTQKGRTYFWTTSK